MERFSEDWQASTRNVFHSFFYFGGHLIHQPTIHNLSVCIPAQVRMPGSGQLRSLLVDSLYAAEATCLNEMEQGTTGERGKLWFLRYEYGYLIGPGKRPPPQKKKSVGGGECRQPASFRTVLAHLDFRPNILHMSRKRTVIQTVLTLQSPSLGVLSMIEYNIHSTDIGPVAP